MRNSMLLNLIIGLLKVGTIGYGGGAAAMPLIKKEFVEKHQLITDDEFIEILGICNVLPGPLITKFCTVLGYKVKGIIGAILAVIALILPSCVMLILILSFIKNAGTNERVENMINCIYPVVTVILVGLTIDFIKLSKSKVAMKPLCLIIIISSILLILLKVSIIFIILALILACFLIPKTEGE